MPEKTLKSLGWIFIALGVLLLIGTGLAINHTRSLLRNGIRTTGNVVDYLESTGDEGQTMYAPVILFLDQQGVEQQVVSNISSSSYAYMMGQAVDVIYRPGNPAGAEILSSFSLWGLAAILGAVGIVFIFAGIGANFIVAKLLSASV